MTPKLAEYIEAGKQLTIDERLAAAHELLASIRDLGEGEASGAEWIAELEGRGRDVFSGAVAAVAGAEAHASIRAELASRRLPRRERRVEPGPLPVGEALPSGAEDVADPVERISLAAAMAEGVLLDAATDVINRGGAELDDVERVQHRSRARTRPVASRVRSTIPVSSFGPRPPSATGFVDT